MSTNCPPVSNMPSMSRRLRPLSMTWVRPSVRGLPGRWGRSRKPSLKAGIELLQLLLGRGLHVVVERVAIGIDADGQRPEILDSELPETLGHQFLPGDLLDLLDLGRLQRGRSTDDREIDHPELAHRLDPLVEDPDLRPVANADDVALNGDLVTGAELEDLTLVGDREGDLVRRHQNSRSKSMSPSAEMWAVARRAAQHW